MFHYVTYYGLAMLAGLVLGPAISSFKNRDSSYWGFVCFLVPPALLMLLAMPRRVGPRLIRGSWHEQDAKERARHHGPD